ncbi:MAG TPA: AI-2E family transporter [Paracoccaceae bacterium]|nr:AI-2E family transporter [Paracoccaceae bacterium]
MTRGAELSLMVIAAVLLFAALEAMQAIAAPVALALVVGVVLTPVSDLWERLGLSVGTGALLTVFLMLAVLGSMAFLFQPIGQRMVEQAPKVLADLADTFSAIRRLVSGFTDFTAEVTSGVAADTAPAPETAASPDMALPSLGSALMLAPALAGQIMIFVGALFFFIHTRRDIYRWAARHLSAPAERAETARRLQDAERVVSRYFLAVTLINLVLGLATALVLQIMGLPGAILWGFLAVIANFVVYVGPATLILLLMFAGVASFDGVMVLLPAAAFVLLNGIEGQFVTPSLVGKQVEVNPLLIFLALIFGIWLWGPIGGTVAIPLMLWVLVLNNMLASPGA